MKSISHDEILDVFHEGRCLLLSRQEKFNDIDVGAKVVVDGRELSVSGIERGRNRLILSIQKA